MKTRTQSANIEIFIGLILMVLIGIMTAGLNLIGFLLRVPCSPVVVRSFSFSTGRCPVVASFHRSLSGRCVNYSYPS